MEGLVQRTVRQGDGVLSTCDKLESLGFHFLSFVSADKLSLPMNLAPHALLTLSRSSKYTDCTDAGSSARSCADVCRKRPPRPV
jgi:hypothetical protein